jgi:RND family efflux transporter MFP subunit
MGGMVLAGAVGIAVGGIHGRISELKTLTQASQQNQNQSVNTLHPVVKDQTSQLVLPGHLEAYNTALIYPRVSGYVKQWHVDIGQNVKAGALLAEIDTPELDDQLRQALAALETAKAHAHLAEITAQRWQAQLLEDAVSHQETDEKTSDFSAKKALVAEAQANVDRLRSLQSFRRITAPFAGIVTTRNTDIGALVNAGAGGKEMFTVADTHSLRLYVSVPQALADQLKLGMTAQLSVPQYPGQHFSAKLVNHARATTESSGTVLVELAMDNSKQRLSPGDYAEVAFQLPAITGAVQIPASTLVMRLHGQQSGLQVALLKADNTVQFKAIDIARDLGGSIEVLHGLSAQDTLIDNPSESLREGDPVRPVSTQP